MNADTLKDFKIYFTEVNAFEADFLNEFYDEEITFIDPIHQIKGLSKLIDYFNKLNANVRGGGFTFTDETIVGDIVYLQWKLEIQLKKPKMRIRSSGISVLVIKDKIVSQRDYFDAGELFYENIPVLGGLIKWIKRKLSHV